ncbi:MAG: hypothetical protein QXJ13_07350 [Candidatus Bathyarchaeia archaeon]
MFKERFMPAPAMKAILSGLLNPSWGKFHRSTIVRLAVYGNRVEIGIGEGNMYQWELDAIRSAPIEHDWINVRALGTVGIEGIKYVPEKKVSGMPRGLLPVQSGRVYVFVSDDLGAIFPAYRCFDINFGERRILSIISPRTLIRDIVEVVHSAFPNERYRGRVNNVEVKAEELDRFFKMNYGIGVLRKRGSVKSSVEAFPLLGGKDIKIIVEEIHEKHGCQSALIGGKDTIQ